MAIKGWIKLHRSLLDWEWYKDNNTKIIYIHLLLNACIDTCKVYNTQLQPGQYITTIRKLATECNITIAECRTAIKHLINTDNITVKSTNKYSLITINNFTKYQQQTNNTNNDTQNNNQTTHKKVQATQDNKPVTSTLKNNKKQTKNTQSNTQDSKQTTDIEKEIKNNKNIKNNNIYNNSCCSSIYIPDTQIIKDYIHNNNYDYDPEYFYNYYKARNWCIGQTPIQDFEALKAIMDNWQLREKNKKSPEQSTPRPGGVFTNYSQRTYTAEELEAIIKRKQGG